MDQRIRDLIEQLIEQFEECHAPEIENDHGGDDFCSYCETIEGAKIELAKLIQST